jgi:transposase-like protein
MAAGEVSMSNKRYTEEFKKEAVRQVIDRGDIWT